VENSKKIYVIYLSPGLEKLSISLLKYLIDKQCEIRVISPLYNECDLNKSDKELIDQYLIYSNIDSTDIPFNNSVYYSDRLLIAYSMNSLSMKYAQLVYNNLIGLVNLSKKNRVILFLEPANDLFSYLASKESSLECVFYKIAKVKGKKKYLWISSELNEIPKNVLTRKKILALKNNFINHNKINDSDGEYWEHKIKWNNISFNNTTINLFKSIKYLIKRRILIKNSSTYLNLIVNYSRCGLIRNLRQYYLKYFYENKLKIFNYSDNQYKFLLFPLQVFPEASTLSTLTHYQVNLIEEISKSLPSGVKLIVKEHIDDVGYRPLFIYKYLNLLFNVEFSSNNYQNENIINDPNFLGLITISSTFTEEVLLAGKPVIIINDKSLYSNCEGVFIYKDIDLSQLTTQLNNFDPNLIKKSVIDIKKEYLKYVIPVDFNYDNTLLYQSLYQYTLD